MSKTAGLCEEILNHPYWRHRIPLSDWKFTPGVKDPAHWEALGLPEDLDGKSVLNDGSFDGMHAFKAERRGAESVLATDIRADATYDGPSGTSSGRVRRALTWSTSTSTRTSTAKPSR